jgi:uncharacterized protein (TIGR03437 family)
MKSFCCWNRACTVLLISAMAIGLPAQTLITLASFDGSNGEGPVAPLVQGTDGNFYGTTSGGNVDALYGTVFKITPSGTLTTLYNLVNGLANSPGYVGYPMTALVQGTDGSFYGTTTIGASGFGGPGAIFKFSPGGPLTPLYFFPVISSGEASADPSALIQADDGNFYETAENETSEGFGTIFKITPAGSLTTLATLNFFSPPSISALIQATDGNFYGTDSFGAIVKITPGGMLTTLHAFNGTDGGMPFAALIQAADGNLYGTTGGGDTAGVLYGTVFKITLAGELTTLYSFGGNDGSLPYGALVQASDGNFYGTTLRGGANAAGTIFRITSAGTLTTLYSFCSEPNCADGSAPYAGLVKATDGNLYGTTAAGGADDSGTVFKVTLASTPPAIGQTGGVLNGASFQAGIVPGSWITIYGTNLSSKSNGWATAIMNGSLPTSLDGVSVSVGGEPAYVAFVSPSQINAVAPNGVTGTVPVVVTNSGRTSPPVNAVVQAAQPAFFLWPGNYAVATTQSYALAVKNGTFAALTTTPAAPGEVIILWGTGFGPTSPSAPEGVEVPSGTTYNTANTVTVTVGGKSATVYGAALAPGFAGLYQVAIQIPSSLANGDYPVVATVSGTQSPSTTLITVQD